MKVDIHYKNDRLLGAELQFVYPVTRDRRAIVELPEHPQLSPLLIGEIYSIPQLGEMSEMQLKQIALKSKADGESLCGMTGDRWIELRFGLPGLVFAVADWSGTYYEIFPCNSEFQLYEGGDTYRLRFEEGEMGQVAIAYRVVQDGIIIPAKRLDGPLFKGYSQKEKKGVSWWFTYCDIERRASDPFVGAARVLLNIL